MQNTQSIPIAIAVEVRNLPGSNFEKKYDRANIRKDSFRVGSPCQQNIHACGLDLRAYGCHFPFRISQSDLVLQCLVKLYQISSSDLLSNESSTRTQDTVHLAGIERFVTVNHQIETCVRQRQSISFDRRNNGDA